MQWEISGQNPCQIAFDSSFSHEFGCEIKIYSRQPNSWEKPLSKAIWHGFCPNISYCILNSVEKHGNDEFLCFSTEFTMQWEISGQNPCQIAFDSSFSHEFGCEIKIYSRQPNSWEKPLSKAIWHGFCPNISYCILNSVEKYEISKLSHKVWQFWSKWDSFSDPLFDDTEYKVILW